MGSQLIEWFWKVLWISFLFWRKYWNWINNHPIFRCLCHSARMIFVRSFGRLQKGNHETITSAIFQSRYFHTFSAQSWIIWTLGSVILLSSSTNSFWISKTRSLESDVAFLSICFVKFPIHAQYSTMMISCEKSTCFSIEWISFGELGNIEPIHLGFFANCFKNFLIFIFLYDFP